MKAHKLLVGLRKVVLIAGALTVTTAGVSADVRTVAGSGADDYSGDGGPAIAAAISQPFGIVIGPDQALYICEVGSHAIRRIDPVTHVITTVAGTGKKGSATSGVQATKASLNEPYEVRFDKDGHMFFVDMMNHVVQKVDAKTGVMTLIAGTGEKGFAGDGGPAVQAKFNRPHSITFDDNGNLYVCDIGNHRIRKVNLESGMITTFCGTGERKPTPDGAAIEGTPLNGPRALDFDGQNSLVLALREGNAIYRMDLNTLTLHHIAGTGKSGYSGDGGPAKKAQLAGPKGVSIAANGDIYFADTESHTVRVIRKTTGILETVIGNGNKGDGPDGRPSACRMDRPHGVFVDQAGRVYVGDSNNHRVRVLAAD